MAALDEIDWTSGDGLVPAIVQHADSGEVLMLGYMDREALARTRATGQVTFWSRSRQRLWTKGETSGNTLELRAIEADCDRDALLLLAVPAGPTCHLGTRSCWGEAPPRPAAAPLAFLGHLDALVAARIAARPAGSYTTRLLDEGVLRIAQKVGEEGLEVALAGAAQDADRVVGEAADLLYHLLVLLRVREQDLGAVVAELERRHAAAART
jgi:phosphoribosyl-ATP pyrophosphohydrolase/phosphoribosyl-AMP cyclohydrolase